MRKGLVVATAALAVAGVAATGMLLRDRGGYSADYRFVTVDRGDILSTVTATGTLSAVTTVQVGAQVSGQISELFADFNSHVHRGQLIARLDPSLSVLAVQQAQAAVQQAVADSMQKAFTLNQATPLHAAGMMTDNDYVAAQAGLQASIANVAQARANLLKAQQDLRYTYIYAPIDGIVIQRNVDVGQTVASSFSAPQLFLIASDLRRMQILVQVDEADIGQIRQGQDVTFTVEAYPNRTYHGTVQQVRLQSAVVQNVVDYTVVVGVNNADRTLMPGMTATVRFQTAKVTDVLRVPNAALRFRPSPAMLAAADVPPQSRGDEGDAPRRAGGGDGAGQRRSFSGRSEAPGTGGAAGTAQPGVMAGGSSGVTVLWTLDASGRPMPVRVRTGLTDGQLTEISGPGLQAGMRIIAAVTNEKSGGSSNPFQQQNQDGFRRRVL